MTSRIDTSGHQVEWIPEVQLPSHYARKHFKDLHPWAAMVQLSEDGTLSPDRWTIYRSHATAEKAEQSAKDLQRVIGRAAPYCRNTKTGEENHWAWFFAPARIIKPTPKV